MHEEIKILEKEKVFKTKDSSAITEDEKPFDIPDSWKWVRLGEILNIESGKGLTAKQMRQGDIPVFGGTGIFCWQKVLPPGCCLRRAFAL